MKPHCFYFTFFLLICSSIPLTAVAEPVNIPDPNLRAAIETALGKQAGAPIIKADMENLTNLQAKNAEIRVLTGLEHATNLTRLGLANNAISDLSALAKLTNLTTLGLRGNSISDISPLARLTKLKKLALPKNGLLDLSPLIPVLSGLTNLTELNLSENGITNISALTGLANLTSLNLSNNSISDISPLVTNTGLGSGDAVNVEQNPLSYSSLHTHIPKLEGRGLS